MEKEDIAYMKDKWFYRGVIIALGLAVVGSIVGYIMVPQDTPEALVAIGAGAVGALAGIFK